MIVPLRVVEEYACVISTTKPSALTVERRLTIPALLVNAVFWYSPRLTPTKFGTELLVVNSPTFQAIPPPIATTSRTSAATRKTSRRDRGRRAYSKSSSRGIRPRPEMELVVTHSSAGRAWRGAPLRPTGETTAVAPVIWSGDGGRKPTELRGSDGRYWLRSGTSPPMGGITNGAKSLTTAPRRLANCSASSRK